MPTKELIEKRAELDREQKALDDVFKAAKTDDPNIMDLSKIALEGCKSEGDKTEWIKKQNQKLNDLFDEKEKLEGVETAAIDQKRRQDALDRGREIASPMIHPAGGGDSRGGLEGKSFGQKFLESKVYQMRRQPGVVEQFNDFEMKTLFDSASWAVQSLRTGRVVPKADQPVLLIDMLPTTTTEFPNVVYMEETTLTLSAAEKAEGAAYAESAFALTERSVAVQKITTSIPITDEQLDDVPRVSDYLNMRLREDLLKRLDKQLMVGNGTAPNLLGINNKASIQTQAKGADPTPDAVHKAITLIRTTGDASPNLVVMHPNDWQDVALLRTTQGVYIFGSPWEAVTPRLWGLPVVQTQRQTENTGVVGDFANYSELVTRKGVDIQIGFVNDDFTKGRKTIRGDFRVAIIWYRAAAFCTVTGI